MPVAITVDAQITLAELSELAMRTSVLRSPHVGSMRASVLGLAEAGVAQIVFDRVPLSDVSSHPGKMVHKDGADELSDPTQQALLATHALVDNPPSGFSHWSRHTVAECHIATFCEVTPKAHVESYSSYLSRHSDVAEAVAGVLSGAWKHYVCCNGAVTNHRMREEGDCVFGLGPQAEGWLFPFVGNVLQFVAAEAIKWGPEIIHVCGTEMAENVGRVHRDLSTMYDMIQTKLGLPGVVQLKLVGAAGLGLVSSARQKSSVDRLLQAWNALVANGHFVRYSPMSPLHVKLKRAIHGGYPALRQEAADLADVVGECDWLFRTREEPRYFSHYDVLGGDGVYVHPEIWASPLGELAQAVEGLRLVCSMTQPQAT